MRQHEGEGLGARSEERNTCRGGISYRHTFQMRVGCAKGDAEVWS